MISLVVTSCAGYVLARTRFPGRGFCLGLVSATLFLPHGGRGTGDLREADDDRRGYARDYQRAHGSAVAADDPFALQLSDNATMRELCLDAEGEDGYYRDRNVFAPRVSIEDDMAVLVTYDTGATMMYHLTAYAPFEGCRVMFNGSGGRLEMNVEESTFTVSTLRPFWSPPIDHTPSTTTMRATGARIHGSWPRCWTTSRPTGLRSPTRDKRRWCW
ncbi:hypothetical protein JOF29_004091 [Kribbella aluminosa]|uniref:Uncharacterized protein n=1 Tax=Kribbella aluminosa TaxID=416017 RepID=A0ABS4UMZ4_9ACTN|nr:hypothetical protein [Kribbella aluminosa]MBP2353008.1 hypothetical protein [Kribbella aluminosa]